MAEHRPVEPINKRLQAAAEELMQHPHPSDCDHLHDAAALMREAALTVRSMGTLLLEARDALPAITMAAARLHGLDLTLADRIEKMLEPWRDR